MTFSWIPLNIVILAVSTMSGQARFPSCSNNYLLLTVAREPTAPGGFSSHSEFYGSHEAQGMVGLNHVNAPVHRLLVFLDPLVLAEGVGEHANTQRVAARDQFSRENLPVGVHGIRLQVPRKGLQG